MGHTPLPWKFKDCEGGTAKYALYSAHEDDALVYLGGDDAEDNKRLLEALPQMLYVLKWVIDEPEQRWHHEAWTALRAAGLLEPELKPCPFCGSTHITRADNSNKVSCESCGAQVYWDCIDHINWNRRAGEA